MAKQKTVCPNCKNEYGFAFGTCCECGYNYLEHKFDFIKVYVSDLRLLLPGVDIEWLTEKHMHRTEKGWR